MRCPVRRRETNSARVPAKRNQWMLVSHRTGAPMSWWLRLPGWLIGSLAFVAIVAAASPPLLRASRARRRVAGLAQAPSVPGAPAVVPHATRHRHRLALMAVVTVASALVSPPLSVAVAVAGWMWPRWRATAARRRHDHAAARELPEVVDLFLVASASGLNLSLSIGAVGERGPPLLGAALRHAAADVDDGARLADALEAAMAPLGDPARPLTSALLGAARYGTALGPALDRLAIETRQLRRRQAEEAIRRVPVKLLFPLVLLVLPAFVLLTVVPLLAGALRSLPL